MRIFAAAIAILLAAGCRDSPRTPSGGLDGGVVDASEVDRDGGTADQPDAGRDGGTSMASAQIAAVRSAAVGVQSPALPVDGAIVTDVRPALGDDPAGFFAQADASGPALFVSVENLVPAVGDVLHFMVTETAMLQSQLAVTGVTAYGVDSSGFNVTLLLQDLSMRTDVVDSAASYDAELVAFFGVVGAFTGLPNAQQRVAVRTAGIPNDSRFTLRVADAVIDGAGLVPGCDVTIGPAPLLATPAGPEIYVWSRADLMVTDCDVPFGLVSATANGPTSVVLAFSRPPQASSVTPAAFTLAPSVAVTDALVNDRRITLTTAPLANETTYTVTVGPSVLDADDASVEPGANSATFTTGGAPGTSLVINEVDYDQPGPDDAEFVELYNGSGSAVSLANLALVFVNGATDAEYLRIDLGSAGTLASGAYLVVKNARVNVPAGVRTFDIDDTTVQNGAPDGIALIDVRARTIIDAISYEGVIEAAAIDGFGSAVRLGTGAAMSARDNDAGSIARIPNGADSGDDDADWAESSTPTPGAANTP